MQIIFYIASTQKELLNQLTVSAFGQLLSQPMGYAITTNRIDSLELNENAFKSKQTLATCFNNKRGNQSFY